MKEKLAILVENELEMDFTKLFFNLIKDGVSVDHIPLKHTNNSNIVAESVKGYDYVIAGREKWDASTLRVASKKLKLIARFGVGVDSIDVDAATRYGIAVSNSQGANARSVAEHALALILSMLRGVTRYDREMRKKTCVAKLTQSLEGTFGFIGYGKIAQNLSQMLWPFNVNMIAYDLYPNNAAAIANRVKLVSFKEVLAKANIISLHLPLNEETHHLINKETISQMVNGVYIINTSRGKIVKETDLIEGIKNKKIKGAALDVFENEPYDRESGLSELEEVILTPHAAAVSTVGVREVFNYCAKMVEDFHFGREVKTIINPRYIDKATYKR